MTKGSIGSLCRATRLSDWVQETTEIPLFGNAPPCNFEKLSSLLATHLDCASLCIKPKSQSYKEKTSFLEEAGPDPFIASATIAPLGALVHFIMSRSDLDKFLSWTVRKTGKSELSPPLKEGFSRFLTLQAVHAIAQMEPFQALTLQLQETNDLSEHWAFCIDLEFTYEEKTCWGRILIPSSSRKKWVQHFSQTPSEYHTTPNSKAMEIFLTVEIGAIPLSLSEWKDILPGDFFPLEKSGYQFAEKSGIAILQFEQIPLFQVRIQPNKIELLDFAMPAEENMDENETPTDHSEEQSETEKQPLEANEEEAGTSIKDVPLQVCVELARLRISLDRLMHLNPGNTLELPIHPEQPLILSINGKKVGKAELLQVGEMLGIRILELG